MKNPNHNPVFKEKIKCSLCSRTAIMIKDTIPFCQFHAPYLQNKNTKEANKNEK